MAFYWSIKSVPEVATLTRKQQRQIWARSLPYGLTRPRTLLVLLALTVVCSVPSLLVTYGTTYGPLIFFLAFPFSVIVAGYLFKLIVMNAARPRMAELAASLNGG